MAQCKWGHEWNAANTYVTPQGYRMCRRCQLASQARWRAAHPEQARAIKRAVNRRWRARQRSA